LILRRARAASPNRLLAIVVAAVLAAGATGWAVGSRVRSPADAAAAHEAPEPSLVTAPVERRILTATVVTRGTVQFGSPQPLTLAGAVGTDAASDGPGSAGAGPAAERVTRPPVVGQALREGSVLMEINGRPVFVFAGSVPMFRTIGPGRSGKDVRQLQRALRRLGMGPGTANGVYTRQTAGAVQRWYRAKGYSAQEPSFADKQQLRTLEQAVQQGVEARLEAKAALDEAKAGGSPTNRTLAALRYRHVVASLAAAQDDLAEYRRQLGTSVPAGEVIFVPSLPVRLTKVAVKTGQSVQGAVGTVTSATVVIQANVTGDDADLLRTGMAARIETPAGSVVAGSVTALREAARLDTGGDQEPPDPDAPPDTGGDSGTDTNAVPLLVTPRDQKTLHGQEEATVKVSVVVGSTSDPVLVVPVAAVTTGADGQARVQVQRSGGRTEDVAVRVGLAALGYVQVSPSGGGLAQGDRVVVGTA
jgi:peptidoglycan hydrolase-like protein with peptidoglycan-binding domain